MVTHLSYSQLSTLTMCGAIYAFRYIDKIPTPVKGEVVRGDAYHKALAFAYSNVVIYKEIPSIDEVIQVYSDTWEKRLRDQITVDEGEEIYIPSVDFRDKDPGKMKDEGVELLRIYYNTILPKIIPYEVEVKKTNEYEGIPLLAYMDLITWDGNVCDHKVKARMFSESELVKDMQSSFYGVVLGKDKFDFYYHTALALKKPEIKIVPVKRDKSDIDWLGKIIVSAWRQIQSGLFTPSTSGWWCGKDCPYWSHCRMPSNF